MVVFLIIIAALNLAPMLTDQAVGPHDLGHPFTGYIANTCCGLSGIGVLMGILMLLFTRNAPHEDEAE